MSNWTLGKIRRSFSGRLIGDLKMRKYVLETVLFLPDKMIKYITSRVWFVSSLEDAWALTFNGSDFNSQHLILLTDELFEQNDKSIKYTILHEIGHVLLRHRNSMGFRQSQEELSQQEKEADKFARKYL